MNFEQSRLDVNHRRQMETKKYVESLWAAQQEQDRLREERERRRQLEQENLRKAQEESRRKVFEAAKKYGWC